MLASRTCRVSCFMPSHTTAPCRAYFAQEITSGRLCSSLSVKRSTARGCSRSRPSTKRAHPGASSSSSCAAPAVRMERWGVRSVPAAGRAAGVPIGRVPAAAAAAAMPPVVAFGGRVCVSQGKVSVSIVTLCHCTSIRTLTCTPRLRCAAADRCAHHSTPSGAHTPTTHGCCRGPS